MYHFYLQQTDKDGTVVSGSLKDLETDFSGLHYLSCTGLESVGKPKNIYTENYAEADGVRVYHPSDIQESVAHEATTVELELLFSASSYRATYNAFRAYVDAKRLYFWDTARHKKVWLFLSEAIEPDEDTIKGIQYIRVKFKFTNIWGLARVCQDNGTVV